MSDVTPEDDQDRNWRALEAERDALRAQAAEAEAAKREIAFLRAGVDVDSKLGQMFVKSYDGDLDVDKVKSEWAEIAPQPATEVVVVDPSEQRQTQERVSLAADTEPPAQFAGKNPKRAGVEEFHRLQTEEGYGRDEASVQFFDKVLTAAVNGDERVLWDAQAQADHFDRAQQFR